MDVAALVPLSQLVGGVDTGQLSVMGAASYVNHSAVGMAVRLRDKDSRGLVEEVDCVL